MQVILNGKTHETRAQNLSELLKEIPDLPKVFAVSVNEEIISKDNFATTPIKDGDTVEVFTFMAGGAYYD